MDEERKAVSSLKYNEKEVLVDYAKCDEDGNNIKNVYAKKRDTQEPLLSGYNIKTINGQSILGSGNISITTCGCDESEQVKKDELSTVALTGDYNDLKNRPTQEYPVTGVYVNGESVMSGTIANIILPQELQIPTKISDLINDVGYITNDQVDDETLVNYEIVNNQELEDLGIDPEDL